MRITWYGTAALLFETDGGAIAFDPFVGIAPGEARPERCNGAHVDDLRRAKCVFVTHGHFDHIIQIPSIFCGTDSTVYATKTPAKTLMRHGVPEGRLSEVAPGDVFTFGTTTVRAFQSRHCRFDAALTVRTLFGKRARRDPVQLVRLLRRHFAYKEKGEILCYEVSSDDVRVIVLGSLGLDPKTSYPQGADLLILPYQGKTDLLPEACRIAERFKPKRIALDHYDDSFPPMSDGIDTGEFEKYVEKEYGIPCRALRKGRPLVI